MPPKWPERVPAADPVAFEDLFPAVPFHCRLSGALVSPAATPHVASHVRRSLTLAFP